MLNGVAGELNNKELALVVGGLLEAEGVLVLVEALLAQSEGREEGLDRLELGAVQ